MQKSLPFLPDGPSVILNSAIKLFDDDPLLARDVEVLSDLALRIRTRRTQLTQNAASSPPEAGIHDQLK